MAVAVQSQSNTAWASATSTVITKPTGLIVGDLLLAIIAHRISGGVVVDAPAGWTLIRSTSDNGIAIDSYYIIATSTETAASNFTFSNATTSYKAGLLLRIAGHSSATPIWANGGSTALNTATPSIAAGITPAVASSFLLTAFATIAGSGTMSGYAIATSNPTWTELLDITVASSEFHTLGVASATRTEVTATGNISVTGATSIDGSTDWAGQLIAIPPSKDSTINDTVSVTDSVLADLTFNVTDTVSATDEIELDTNRIHNSTKNLSTFTNLDKS